MTRAARLLICGVGSGMERSVATALEMCVEPVVVTDGPPEVEQPGYARLKADPHDALEVVSVLDRAGYTGFDGVMTLGYDNPPTISRLAAKFGCPGIPVDVAVTCTRKDKRAQTLARHGVGVAASRTAQDVPTALGHCEELGYPVVVKPADRWYSIGVQKVASADDATTAIARALALSNAETVVVEEFLVGTEHTVAGIAIGGEVLITSVSDRAYDRKEEFLPYFFEEGDTLPTVLDPHGVDRVVTTVTRGVRALGIDHGVFNTDILVEPGGNARVIELTCRMTAARIVTEIVPLATGVDILPNAIRLALGEQIVREELLPSLNRAVVQRYLPCDSGVVRWIGDLASCGWPDQLYDVFWGRPLAVGERLPAFKSNEDVIAGAIAYATTVEEAEAVAGDVLARLPIRIER